MGSFRTSVRPVLTFSILLIGLIGCDTGQKFSQRKLIEHQAMLDFSGLADEQRIDSLKVSLQTPEDWTALPLRKNAIFTHQQWRSPSRATGVGVAYVRLPFPLPIKTLVWFAKQEYSKRNHDGKVIGEWTDEIGRQWFEAQNDRYHVRGYIVLQSADAWFIYSGYKTAMPLNPPELTLASKCVETITPSAKARPDRYAAAE